MIALVAGLSFLVGFLAAVAGMIALSLAEGDGR